MALSAANLSLVTWLCAHVGDPRIVFESQSTPLLSHHVLLSLVQQLGYDLDTDSLLKIKWLEAGTLLGVSAVCVNVPH